MLELKLVRRLVLAVGAGLALILAVLPATAMAGPAAAPANTLTRPPAIKNVTSQNVPVRRACAAPKGPRYAACDALVRTDWTANQGHLARGVDPQGYGPADLQSAYALPSHTAGAGATVAIVDAYDDPSAAADLAVYRAQYGLPPCTVSSGCFRKVDQTGGRDYPPIDDGWAEEISLDLDMVSAACPRCHILLVEANSNALNDLGTAVDEAVALGARYVSNSYSASEGFTGEAQADAQYYDHPGVVVTAASGDYGWPGGFPASSPHVVAVGGTTLTKNPRTTRGWTETAWSGTGSGCDLSSDGFTKPAWQHDTGCPTRTFNDVSAVADPATGLAVYDSGLNGWFEVGGTSAATPLIAAVYALAGTPVNGTYPASYPYAHPTALNDVTSGSNGSGCSPAYVCSAGPGYDGPTGLGTPEGVSAFAGASHGTVMGTVRDSAGAPVAGAEVRVGTAATYTDGAGRYTTTAVTGGYTPTAAKFGYATATGAAITVASGGSVTENFTLTRQPTVTVSGTVSDASGQGWPLYAQIQAAGTPAVAYTNPATGRYQLTLPAGHSYTLDATAQYPGYQPQSTTITVRTSALSQDIGLRVDPVACSAPGYHPVVTGINENFGSGKLPSGWSLSGNTLPQWSWAFNNPNHRPNLTGGTGGFAIADAIDWNGNGSPFAFTELDTPLIDLTHATNAVLRFRQDLSIGDPEVAHANVNITSPVGGLFGVYSAAQSVPGPNSVVVSLQPYAGNQVQLHFQTLDVSSSWELSDVSIGDQTCKPTARSGLVVGRVTDRNTSQPVNGATVSGAGQQVGTLPEPGDPAVGGGLYWLATPAGTQTLTAAAGGYSDATARLNVTAGQTVSAGFSLAAPRLSVTPATASVTEQMGKTSTVPVTITNTGTAPATVGLTAQQGTVTVSGATARKSAPAERIPGHYLPVLLRGGTAAHRSAPYVPPWTTLTGYPDYVYDNAAATDPATGNVYSVGGSMLYSESHHNPETDAFVYRPVSQSWSRLPTMPVPLTGEVAGVIGGRLYVTAGVDVSFNSTELISYDPRDGRWLSGPPIPQAPGYGAIGSVLDGKLYVIGGCAVSGTCESRQVQVFDPATGVWSRAASYPTTIAFGSCGAISGKLYCAGGFVQALGRGTTAAYVYDPAANAWTPIASLPIGLWSSAGAAANGQLLVSGGITGITGFHSELTNAGYAYDPSSGSWSPLPNAPDARYRSAAACGFYTIGGLDANGVTADVEQLPGYGQCDGGTGVGWLTSTPGTLTLAPGQRATVTLTFAAGPAAVPQPGTYTATVTANSGAPYPAPRVAATLTATPPSTWAGLSGTVSGKDCSGATAPVDAATVQAGGRTLTTGPDGKYVLWVPSKDGPLSVIASASTWLAQAATAVLKAGVVSTLNFTLKRASCG